MLEDQERAELHRTIQEIQADAERRRREETAQWHASVRQAGWRDLLPFAARRH